MKRARLLRADDTQSSIGAWIADGDVIGVRTVRGCCLRLGASGLFLLHCWRICQVGDRHATTVGQAQSRD
jgi:hypothetical protein